MRVLYAATGNAIARLQRRDDHWDVVSWLEGSGAHCLALDPREPGVIYAGSGKQGVWKSADGGKSWVDLRLPEQAVFSVAVSPVDGAVYAGCEPSMLFRSRDGGQTWEELEALRHIPSAPTWSFPPRPWTSHVSGIAPSPHQTNTLLVGIELGGLMRTEDGGQTWEDHRPGAQPDVHALGWHPSVPGRAYEAGGGGAAWSQDNGRTWEPADNGRDRNYTWGLAIDPMDPDCWFISASPGPREAHYGGHAQAFVYRWRGGGPWQALAGGIPQPLDSMPYALSITPETLFAGLGDGRLYSSSDRGDTWRAETVTGAALKSIVALVPAL